MMLSHLVEETFSQLKSAGLPTPRLDAEILIAQALELSRIDLHIRSQEEVEEQKVLKIIQWTQRRAQGEPVAYILGEKEFYSRNFKVRPGVLVPRPETECLVEEVLRRTHGDRNKALRLIDFGSGSGCLGLTLLKEFPSAELLSVDISADAEEVTRENAQQLSVSERFHFLRTSVEALQPAELPTKFSGGVDWIVANPPYIDPKDPEVQPSVVRFEPWTALFAEENGMSAIQSWCRKAAMLLRAGGHYIFEIGARQGSDAKEFVESLRVFDTVQLGKDYAGFDRWVYCQKTKVSD